MLHALYDWTLRLAASRNATRALAGVSFAESVIFPIPPDVLLIPMVIARPKSAWRLAFITTVASVVGGLFGYLIGALAYDAIAAPIINFYGYQDKFLQLQQWISENGLLLTLIAGLTPVPFKLFTITAGVASLNVPIFILGAILSRGARFFLISALLRVYGEAISEFIARRLGLLTALFGVLLVAGFALVKYL